MSHNEIEDELWDLLTKALVPLAVRDEPIIYPCRPAVPTPAKEPDPSDASIHLSMTSMETFSYLAFGPAVWIVSSMFESHEHRCRITTPQGPPDKVLSQHECEKKRKYLEP
jgi:hypothetical protein